MSDSQIVVITGGVGGAKLAEGLYHLLPAHSLSLIVNTGDDFDHLGLRICPDLDTTLYTLAGLANRSLGWGRENESWNFMETLAKLGGDSWFRIGDNDLALHVKRTQRLAEGASLSAIMAEFSASFDLKARLYPMTDNRVATAISSDIGELNFQDYFVRHRCEPQAIGFRFSGAEVARASAGTLAALKAKNTRAIVIAPSNPYLSIDPILSITEIRTALAAATVPVIAVTPIISGKAVKGPAAKIMRELGVDPSPVSVARHYRGFIDGFILDDRDGALESEFDLPVAVADTMMTTLEDKKRVGAAVLAFSDTLRKGA